MIIKGNKYPQIADALKAKYGEDHFKKIGSMGGKISRGGGFTGDSELAKIIGAKGGRGRLGGKYPHPESCKRIFSTLYCSI